MATSYFFQPGGFTPEVYDATLKQLEAAGAGAPAGRTFHAAIEVNGLIQVFDVWESEEAFNAFGATLIPIMTGGGVDPGQPMVAPIHNVIKG
jgi:hypothetical protein